MQTILVKVIGTACSVASGLPVGPEGPLVHIGAGVASFCTRQQRVRFGGRNVFSTHDHRWLDTFHNDGDRRDFLSAGVASGLAAAFGAPIGGVLFSLEEASTFWSHDTTWRSLLCSTMAIFTLSLLHTVTSSGALATRSSETLLSIASPGLLSFGDVAYDADTTATFYVWELPIFVALAAAAGVVGAALTHASSVLAPRRPKTRTFRVAEAVATAALCVTLALVTSHLFGSCRPVPLREPALLHGAGGAGGGTAAAAATTDDGGGFTTASNYSSSSSSSSSAAARAQPEERWGESVAVRLTCPKGEFNDLAALLLGLRDEIIANVLSVGSEGLACTASANTTNATTTAASERRGARDSSTNACRGAGRDFPFSTVSVCVALVVTLLTMVIACDLSLPAGMFMPTILWGALLGSLFGFAARTLATMFFDDPRAAAAVAPGTYALVGSTAALAGSNRNFNRFNHFNRFNRQSRRYMFMLVQSSHNHHSL